jgi:hypothetical protein
MSTFKVQCVTCAVAQLIRTPNMCCAKRLHNCRQTNTGWQPTNGRWLTYLPTTCGPEGRRQNPHAHNSVRHTHLTMTRKMPASDLLRLTRNRSS